MQDLVGLILAPPANIFLFIGRRRDDSVADRVCDGMHSGIEGLGWFQSVIELVPNVVELERASSFEDRAGWSAKIAGFS